MILPMLKSIIQVHYIWEAYHKLFIVSDNQIYLFNGKLPGLFH